MAYIERGQPAGCPFCPPDEEGPLDGDLVVAKGRFSFAALNLYPYNTGHMLILPARHVGDVTELDNNELAEIGISIRTAISVLRAAYSPAGFNVGANLGSAAGAGLPDHLHFHIVPRFDGDTNFLPVLGETKVIPEELGSTLDKLRSLWPPDWASGRGGAEDGQLAS